jgi:molybdopterin-binding protein
LAFASFFVLACRLNYCSSMKGHCMHWQCGERPLAFDQRRAASEGSLQKKAGGGFPLVVMITRRSLEELGLGVGDRVMASFKASAVHVIPRLAGG